jgi:hypothetical protein
MRGLVIELPPELHMEVTRRAGQEPGSESAWVVEAVREKLAACAQLDTLRIAARVASARHMSVYWPRLPLPTQFQEMSGTGRA